eukprot:299968-Rhodomonas_salina.2
MRNLIGTDTDSTLGLTSLTQATRVCATLSSPTVSTNVALSARAGVTVPHCPALSSAGESMEIVVTVRVPGGMHRNSYPDMPQMLVLALA